ncbi:MAG: hypothetical protein ACD_54C00817G0003 [uncultured bacterium]|nr:MAG: hypothetical protein ACD_54C00817G0003 [uncultured bacterium]
MQFANVASNLRNGAAATDQIPGKAKRKDDQRKGTKAHGCPA